MENTWNEISSNKIPQEFLDHLFGSFSQINNENAHSLYIDLCNNPNTIPYLLILISNILSNEPHPYSSLKQYLPLFISFLYKLFHSQFTKNLLSQTDPSFLMSQLTQLSFTMFYNGNFHALMIFVECLLLAIETVKAPNFIEPFLLFIVSNITNDENLTNPILLNSLLISLHLVLSSSISKHSFITNDFFELLILKLKKIIQMNKIGEDTFLEVFIWLFKLLRQITKGHRNFIFKGDSENEYFVIYSFSVIDFMIKKLLPISQANNQQMELLLNVSEFISLFYNPEKYYCNEKNQKLIIQGYLNIIYLLKPIRQISNEDNRVLLIFLRIVNNYWYDVIDYIPSTPEFLESLIDIIINISDLYNPEIEELYSNPEGFYVSAFVSDTSLLFPHRVYISSLIESILEKEMNFNEPNNEILSYIINLLSKYEYSDSFLFFIIVLCKYITDLSSNSDQQNPLFFHLNSFISHIFSIQPTNVVQELHRNYLISLSIPFIHKDIINTILSQMMNFIKINCEISQTNKIFFTIGCKIFCSLLKYNNISISDFMNSAMYILMNSANCYDSDTLLLFDYVIQNSINSDQIKIIYSFIFNQFEFFKNELAENDDKEEKSFIIQQRIDILCDALINIIDIIHQIENNDSNFHIYDENHMMNIINYFLDSDDCDFTPQATKLLTKLFLITPNYQNLMIEYINKISQIDNFTGEFINPLINFIDEKPICFNNEFGLNILYRILRIFEMNDNLVIEENIIPFVTFFGRILFIINPIPMDIIQQFLHIEKILPKDGLSDISVEFLKSDVIFSLIFNGYIHSIEDIIQYILRSYTNGLLVRDEQRYSLIIIIDQLFSNHRFNEEIKNSLITIRQSCLINSTPQNQELQELNDRVNMSFIMKPLKYLCDMRIEGFVFTVNSTILFENS
ncbi:hypothetical protein TRFO_28158 [Tritrichomonas foetus]|uniref:Uncharacterized protein n=1 Tax=Tritrichomonas foetus TaxID=1144522 RepID=A0A1J4K3M8_9EUKA|nr:hypothetical protein TRFO_28158 [Tritrichomonas foetus]|eukprot:OHT04334.1 hypothetical protein TRFO_28158 [Tritrichomonas foetus]